MSVFTIIVVSFGLSLDAFAVSICKGLSVEKPHIKNALICGLYFGIFQALMPLIGYFIGFSFADIIKDYDHWVAFVLLSIIGLNMIKEGITNDTFCDPDFSFRAMFPLAIATSIDALVVGMSIAFLKSNIYISIIFIGIITFLMALIGTQLGFIFGQKFKKRAEILGGILLIFIGLKILFEHLELLPSQFVSQSFGMF